MSAASYRHFVKLLMLRQFAANVRTDALVDQRGVRAGLPSADWRLGRDRGGVSEGCRGDSNPT